MRDKGKGKRVTMRLTNELYGEVAAIAQNNYQDLAAYIRQLVINDVTKKKRQNKVQ